MPTHLRSANASCEPYARTQLHHLPSELHYAVFDHLTSRDACAALGATSRHWRALYLTRLPSRMMSAQGAFTRGDTRDLANALSTPVDASSFFTGARDASGMTRLMHAATRPPDAMLRCLLRHCSDDLAQTDIAGLNARNWAVLYGNLYAFEAAVERIRPQAQLGRYLYGRHNLHRAISLRHTRLTACLLATHHIADNPWQNPWAHPGFAPRASVSCGLTAAVCMQTHAGTEYKALRDAPGL